MWLVILGVLLLGVAIGYALAVLTGTPFVETIRERQRIEHERRLAELQLRRLSHEAMQRLLHAARTSQ